MGLPSSTKTGDHALTDRKDRDDMMAGKREKNPLHWPRDQEIDCSQ